VTELMTERLDADDHVEVYACGPPAMLEAVRELCARRDVPVSRSSLDGVRLRRLLRLRRPDPPRPDPPLPGRPGAHARCSARS
jgi:NAD(P)H-flavin reductase